MNISQSSSLFQLLTFQRILRQEEHVCEKLKEINRLSRITTDFPNQAPTSRYTSYLSGEFPFQVPDILLSGKSGFAEVLEFARYSEFPTIYL